MSFTEQGCVYTTRELKVDDIVTKLKPTHKHVVLLLDTVMKETEVSVNFALDCLSAIGYCKFDDIVDCLGQAEAEKVLAFVTKKIQDTKKAEKVKNESDNKPKQP